MTENDLFHKTLTKDTSLIDLIEGTSCKVADLGSGDTGFTVERMAQMVYDTLPQTVKIANELRRRHGGNIPAIHKALNDFLWKNYKYKFDGYFQDLRSPGCAKSTRLEGIDCKGVSITASSILINLGIPHSIRRVKKIYDRPDEFTHVYVVIHHNGKTLAVDGTTNIYEEQPYNEADDYIMKHRGLNSPQTKDPQKAASASRHARMLKTGTTKAVRSIGGKGLARYRASLGLPTLTYPKKMNEASAKIAALQIFLERLVKQGASSSAVANFLRDLKYNLDNNINAVARLGDGKLHLGSKTYDLRPNGLAFSLDFSNLSNVFGGPNPVGGSGQPAPTSGGSGINVGQVGGAAIGTAVLPGVGTALGSVVGGFFQDFVSGGFALDCIGGNWYGKEEAAQNKAALETLTGQLLRNIQTAAESGNTVALANSLQDALGKSMILSKTFKAKADEGWASCTTKGLRGMESEAKKLHNQILNDLIPQLEQFFVLTRSMDSKVYKSNEPWLANQQMFMGTYIGKVVEHSQGGYKISIKPNAQPTGSIGFAQTPGTTQNPTNSNIPNQGTVKTGGISTTTAAVGGGIILTGIVAAALYFGKKQPAA